MAASFCKRIFWTPDTCKAHLKTIGKPIDPKPSWSGGCAGGVDAFLCWPAAKPNSTISQRCPYGLSLVDHRKYAYKSCLDNGTWFGTGAKSPMGRANYMTCISVSDTGIISDARKFSGFNRNFEFLGLFLSFVSLLLAVVIFLYFKRLRVFRNYLHVHLMLAILAMSVVRLFIYIDVSANSAEQNLLRRSPIACAMFYALLEWAKTCSYMFMVMEGYYLHNTLVVSVFGSEPKLRYYCLIGWLVPVVHIGIWVIAIVFSTPDCIPPCLGNYYEEPQYWILDGIRLLYLVVNICFLANIIRVLWVKVKESHTSTETERLKKSVKAAAMLIPLLGIPNILQLIPIAPTRQNFLGWKFMEILGTIFYMYQGFFISLLYCFTNNEVIDCIRSYYQRFKMRHTDVRRGSRAHSLTYNTHMSTKPPADNNDNANNLSESRFACPYPPPAPPAYAPPHVTSSPGTEESIYTAAQVQRQQTEAELKNPLISKA